MLALLAAPVAAGDSGPGNGGGGGDDRAEVRQAGTCTSRSKSKLRLRAEEGWIRIDFEVDSRRAGSAWRVILLHERRIVLRTTRRTVGPEASFEVRRIVEDWFGADAVIARATGPRGEVCRASASI